MNPDYNDTRRTEQKLKDASARMEKLAPEVGHSKQILRFANERQKGLLAKYAEPFLKADESSTSANTKARANPAYQAELQEQIDQVESAHKAISEYDAAKCTYEAARSLLSLEKAKINL